MDMESELTKLRVQADTAQMNLNGPNGPVLSNVEELSIDLNKMSNVDKQPLHELRVNKAELRGQNINADEIVGHQANHIRSEADFLQGKISEYETLLLSYADEKSYLISEIERMRMELNRETNQGGYQ